MKREPGPANRPNAMFSRNGRKPRDSRGNPHEDSPDRKPSSKTEPVTVELWGDDATNCITVPPPFKSTAPFWKHHPHNKLRCQNDLSPSSDSLEFFTIACIIKQQPLRSSVYESEDPELRECTNRRLSFWHHGQVAPASQRNQNKEQCVILF